jgi:hypothetical protein
VFAVTEDLRTEFRLRQPQLLGGKRRRYLPSEQVVREISLVRDWSGLADELRDCLSDERTDATTADPPVAP